MISFNIKNIANRESRYEKEITDFLKNLPGGDSISGVGFAEAPEPANDNASGIDSLEIGVPVPAIKAEPDEDICIAGNDNHRQELDFTEARAGRRGFLQEDPRAFTSRD